MSNLINTTNEFCKTNTTPLIVVLVFSAIFVLAWGIYQKKIEAEDFVEKRLDGEYAAVLTNLSASQGSDNQPTPQKSYNDAMTSATPGGGYRIAGGNSQYYLQDAYKQTIARMRPSVVNIKALQAKPNRSFNSNTDRQALFFSPDGQNFGTNYESVGSGIIVSPQGHILTNYHVIANASRIIVTVYGMNRQNYDARVVDHHIDTDLTLLKIDIEAEFKPADLGNSDLVEVGDLVLAFGSPFGLEQSVTSGIVSGKRKSLVINGITYTNMIQTDAPINQGSSGGPLTSISGQVIGINTAIYAPTGVFNGTGFAMPINRVKRFLAEHNILSTGNFALASNTNPYSSGRGWLGIEAQPIDNVTALHLGLPYNGGALINRVFQDSPAWRKGLKRGDVILEFDGRRISDTAELEYLISNLRATETVRILVYRGKKFEEFYVALSDMPVVDQFD